MSGKIKLYAAPFGGSAIVEAALTLCELDFDTIDAVDFEQLGKLEGLRAVNPLCQVPTLVFPDGQVMSESAAIILHLGAEYPASGLMPVGGSADSATFLRWLVFVVANIYPTFTYGDFPERYVSSPGAGDELVAATGARREGFWRNLESVASEIGPWFLASGFSALDIYIWVMTHWRPRRKWFAAHCPRLSAIALALDGEERLQAVNARNFAGRK